MQFVRYAIYYTPPDGPLACFGAQWLGWDVTAGLAAQQPDFDGLPAPLNQITQTPRRYGFHATLKPPFRLADGQRIDALCEALDTLSYKQKPISLDGLHIAALGSFLALVPHGNTIELSELAAKIVRDLDGFRAAPSPKELGRRRHHRLSTAQENNLTRWGYPHVMDQFHFHMTLTGKLSKADLDATQTTLEPVLGPLIPQPFTLSSLTLAGEDDQGMFHQIHRYAFSAPKCLPQNEPTGSAGR